MGLRRILRLSVSPVRRGGRIDDQPLPRVEMRSSSLGLCLFTQVESQV